MFRKPMGVATTHFRRGWPRPGGSRDGGSSSARVLRQAPDRPADALVRAMAGPRTAAADSGAGRTRLMTVPLSTGCKSFLRAQFGEREASAPASPSRGPGNGILRAETGGRFQAQNAGERSEFGSQTATRLTNRPELRGFLSTRKPPRFVGTAWWRTQSSRTSLRRPKFSDNANPFAVNVLLGGPKRRLFALFIALEHSSLQCVSRS